MSVKHFAATVVGTLFGLGLPLASPAAADDFFARNDLRIMVGSTSGGGYDTYARLLARHIGNHLPGTPKVIVSNKVGAAGLAVANELYNVYPRDGSTIATPNRNIPTEPLFGNPAARYDALKFGWIGSMNNEVSVCGVWHTVPVNTANDMITRGMVVGGSSSGDDSIVFPKILNALLGTKLKIISGYPGGNDINLAIERGEVEGRCALSYSSLLATRPDWVKDNKLRVILQLSFGKHPDLPNVPTILDIASKDKQGALRLIFARQYWGRPYLAPPGVPPERLDLLRTAFMDTMRDPAFLSEAERSRIEVQPVSGADIEREVKALYALPSDVVASAKAAMQAE
jgi:tripartite-type tricarboxylate transporter receptor subunit TctC